MELILSERSRTYIAFMSGEEWTEYGASLTRLDDLCSFILSKQADGHTVRTVMREDGNEIIIEFFNGVGIVTSQISICYNEGDREKIISELGGFCQQASVGT
ncbi:MAG: hypothetical protein A3A13_00535 [Candidatus Yanofskybacteria bacterium RIFCSPLOWO2_01_FULL_43_22]|uniref:Uncharacterized protein n=1 Tax=Candidatus Yanofskybacteria bacterium RIFCSPLOWO2_01_FULL_43_22 TaxID=1802695 RepID=A0A1F8GGN6_9BACT|nr:MAG: hypothetical protein A3D48_02320 [Candidatus Yanofskybacteria bacterium RIFCSPHIGHO2_02_FULL_43_17]OGN24554.1 MAG: hypothetical protein A3A13_00535 [Candidatus Yanofskybacteria bacterium RIFCSPLOWO2_01_FULL_43_22]